MIFLLTNDDGVDSPGLGYLAEALAELGKVYVVAPERERSADGHSITMHKPLRVKFKGRPSQSLEIWESSGSPADCVVIGIFDILPSKPDLIISGINLGSNLGEDVTYSGTVSGALEGFLCDVPSVAFSLATFEAPLWDTAVCVSKLIVQTMLDFPEPFILNVNIPNLPLRQLKGILFTKLGRRRYIDRLNKRVDPFGRPYYWIGGYPEDVAPQEGTDIWAIKEGFVSISPIKLDLTDYDKIKSMESWRERIEHHLKEKCPSP